MISFKTFNMMAVLLEYSNKLKLPMRPDKNWNYVLRCSIMWNCTVSKTAFQACDEEIVPLRPPSKIKTATSLAIQSYLTLVLPKKIKFFTILSVIFALFLAKCSHYFYVSWLIFKNVIIISKTTRLDNFESPGSSQFWF